MNAEELEQIWELLDRITTYPESAVDNVDEINEVLARFRDLAPVPSGEVETPCATCGGRGAIPSPWSPDDLDAEQSPCPDCGVETPEAAVEERAADVASPTLLWLLRRAGDEWGPAGVALVAADLAQGWTPPGTEER